MMWKVHGFWFFIGLGATLSLSLMNWMEPTMRVFLSSVLCDSEQVHADQEQNHLLTNSKKNLSSFPSHFHQMQACPVPSLALSVLQQVHLTVYFYFANLFYDVLPVAYSAHCTTVMKVKKCCKRMIKVQNLTLHNRGPLTSLSATSLRYTPGRKRAYPW